MPKYKIKRWANGTHRHKSASKVERKFIAIPKAFKGFTIKPRCVNLTNFEKLNQVRIIPCNQIFCIEIVYSVVVDDTNFRR